MSDGEVRYSRDGDVVMVIFDRPAARNAMTWHMYEQLGDACARIRREHGLRAAVFRGAGGKAFIAGTDIAQFQAFRSGEDGIAYEAFNTSGGLGTLCDTLDGSVENLNYKTVRYPGHRDLVKMLIRDLRLGQRREVLKDVLEASVPMTRQDVVLVFVTVSGMQEGRLTQESFAKKVYSRALDGTLYSAIQITTAAGVCAMVDMAREGALPNRGFVRQEDADLERFLGNRFGAYYA